MTETELAPHNAAYQRLKESISQSYPHGWFVAIAEDRIVAASADFRELKGLVRAEGFDPRNVLIVEAGVRYPDFVDVLAGVGRTRTIRAASLENPLNAAMRERSRPCLN